MPGMEKHSTGTAATGVAETAARKIGEAAPHAQRVLSQAGMALQKVEPVIRAVYPYCVMAWDASMQAYIAVKPYYDAEVGNIALALALLFLGGEFAMTIACWQVFQASGHRMISKSWAELCSSFQEAWFTVQKDADFNELFQADKTNATPLALLGYLKELSIAKSDTEHYLARRRVLLVMKCIDPTKIGDATLGLWTGIVAVLATLRSRFVRSVSVGANVGKKMVEIMFPLVQPRLHEKFPNHRQWVDFCLRSSGGIVGAIVSMLLIRMISAFNSAVEGASLLVKHLLVLAERKKWLDTRKVTVEQSRLAVWCCAFVGFIVQFKAGFDLPLILKLPLTPLLIVENLLSLLSTVRV